ncbi:hypothetical protein Cgig2_015885 [Carnegiea gigantea]|uniref:Translin n=1 Tax=Carnegiea gigantea TaxID=171969 RepID=A0A9Q1GZL3_9CARY|nr:hypothetical protein Cgig2_015885 [Carnegiea gigantea]
MKAFRNAIAFATRPWGSLVTLNPNSSRIPNLPLRKPLSVTSSLSHLRSRNPLFRFLCTISASSSPPMADGGALAPLDGALEAQFETFRTQLEESSNLREGMRNVAMQLDSASRIMHANILLVHQSRPINDILEKAKSQIGVLKGLYSQLAEILRECPGQYYRYHNEWRSETQMVVSLLAFMHWLETGSLLLHPEAQEKLGCGVLLSAFSVLIVIQSMKHWLLLHLYFGDYAVTTPDFGLDIEDYLVGICFMSNELPRYVVNRVTYGDYDCPRKVLNFLTDLHAAFRMLNLRNDFLRKKFDGMKYDLKRVEEVYYDVKIRGLTQNGNSNGDQAQS